MSEIKELVERFLAGTGVSLSAANSLEVLLDEAYPDDNQVQELIEMLARYRPRGGEWLFNESDIELRLVKVRNRL
jgi:hypothetical protein